MEDFAMVRRGPFGAATVTAAVVTVLALALAGCAPGVQPLLDEYNALFGSVTERGQEGAQEDGDWFSKESYDVSVHDSLDLHAPPNCTSYEWTLEPDPEFPGVELPADFRIEDHLQNGGSYLDIGSMRGAGFKAGTRYILTCTVVRDGKTLGDRCYIVVTE